MLKLFELQDEDNRVIFTEHAACLRDAVQAGLEKGNLVGVVLSHCDFSGVNFHVRNLERAWLANLQVREANLAGVDLNGSSVRNVCFDGSDLSGVKLLRSIVCGSRFQGVNLSGANLAHVEFRNVVFTGANFKDATITSASWFGCTFTNTNLREANLTPIRDDFWGILCSVPDEVAGLRNALVKGKVDGTTYTGGCSCLVGTIARLRKSKYDQMPDLRPDVTRPAERFFTGICRTDTPETNQFSAIVVEWIDEWIERMTKFFGPQPT